MADGVMANDAFVVFDRVQKSYDGCRLSSRPQPVHAQGEFLTMLGPSGSGKTTCLMMLGRFRNRDPREIRLDGRNINTSPRINAASAWCFRTTRFSRT